MGGWEAFRSDVVESVQVWARIPIVALIAVVLAVSVPVAGIVGPGPSVVVSLGLLTTIGFYGTQRLAFARERAGLEGPPGLLFVASIHYWGRFARLGLIMGLLMVPVPIVLGAGAAGDPESISAAAIFITCGAAFVLDVLATFATPALVFHTPKAWAAFRTGRRLLSETWSETKFHALLPPLVPLLVGQMVSGDHPAAGIVVSAFGAVVAFVARGAHTIAYLRHRPITPAALPSNIAEDYLSGSLWADRGDRRRKRQRFREQRREAAAQEPDLNKINEAWARRRQQDS